MLTFFRSRITLLGIIGGVLAVIALLTGIAVLLSSSRIPLPSTNQLTVATTIFPLTDIARNIAGNSATILQLLPPGASEHSYTLSPQQVSDLEQADVLFVIGQGLDDWATRPLSRTLSAPIIGVDQNIELRPYQHKHEEEHEGEETVTSIDPHYWLTVPNAQVIARTIATHLARLDPAHAAEYQRNLTTYLRQLDTLEQELQSAARRAPQKKFIAIHDAWSYFADHYGFELLATYEPIEGQNPSLADLQELQKLIQIHRLTAFYTEPQKQSTSATRFLREDLHLNIKVLDPIGGLAPHDSYLNLMRQNVTSLVTP